MPARSCTLWWGLCLLYLVLCTALSSPAPPTVWAYGGGGGGGEGREGASGLFASSRPSRATARVPRGFTPHKTDDLLRTGSAPTWKGAEIQHEHEQIREEMKEKSSLLDRSAATIKRLQAEVRKQKRPTESPARSAGPASTAQWNEYREYLNSLPPEQRMQLQGLDPREVLRVKDLDELDNMARKSDSPTFKRRMHHLYEARHHGLQQDIKIRKARQREQDQQTREDAQWTLSLLTDTAVNFLTMGESKAAKAVNHVYNYFTGGMQGVATNIVSDKLVKSVPKQVKSVPEVPAPPKKSSKRLLDVFFGTEKQKAVLMAPKAYRRYLNNKIRTDATVAVQQTLSQEAVDSALQMDTAP